MPTTASTVVAPIDWDALDAGKYEDETAAVARLLKAEPLGPDAGKVKATAVTLVNEARRLARRQGVVEGFLQEFGLSTPEGLALMCLAEALLRTPDEATRDALIAEKIGSADWAAHVGRSDSVFVNAGTWGLMLTGRLVEPDEGARRDLAGFLRGLAGRIGEPVIRRAVATAIGVMGDQFVLGRTIHAALRRAARSGFICSFDMLGEGARTYADAERYEAAYLDAIAAVGEAAGGHGPEEGHGISVKLSALHPRYEATQEKRVFDELYPRLLRIVTAACEHDINLTLDAEEADRLALSLKLLAKLAEAPELHAEWRGLGLAVQAYQKRGAEVIDQVAELARRSGRRLMVRLVKGAYWDAEIKRAQVGGRPDYPVFTTKAATDLGYLVCADRLLAAAPALYGQFATHNAHTLAAVRQLSERRGVRCERQRLHGMGEALHAAASARWPELRLRVYAPVGGHEDLLPYLVRRLLENGANTSFVHALLDDEVPAETVAGDPLAAVRAQPGPHPKIPKPRDIFLPERRGAAGVDLSIVAERGRLTGAVATLDAKGLPASPNDATPRRHRRCLRRGARRPARLGRRRRSGSGEDAERRRRRDGSAAAGAGRAADPRGRQDAGRRRRRGARGGGLLPLLRRHRRARLRRTEAIARTGRRVQRHRSCTAAAFSSRSVRGTSRSRSSPARSPRRWRPATRWSPSPPSRPRASPPRPCACSMRRASIPGCWL